MRGSTRLIGWTDRPRAYLEITSRNLIQFHHDFASFIRALVESLSPRHLEEADVPASLSAAKAIQLNLIVYCSLGCLLENGTANFPPWLD